MADLAHLRGQGNTVAYWHLASNLKPAGLGFCRTWDDLFFVTYTVLSIRLLSKKQGWDWDHTVIHGFTIIFTAWG
jgi:hypothetical protein